MCFPLVIDRGVSRYLQTTDFMSFRKTSLVHYNDKDAWSIYACKMPLNCPGISARQKVGLHFLFYWALQFPERMGTMEWYQRMVNWLEHKTSIKIMYFFLLHSQFDFLRNIDTSKLDGRRRFVWLRLWHRNSRVFKRTSFDNIDERPQKHTVLLHRNTQQRCR